MRKDVVMEVRAVSKNFGGLPALKNVSFDVGRGEILAIIGPNGAGKTTLFNVISGVLQPSTGKIYFEGRDITRLPPFKRAKLGIARTFQIPRPFSEMTVLENVIVGMVANGSGLSLSDAKKRAYEILEELRLSKKADVRVRELNLQEKKSVELGRALALDPKVLLIDEYMSGLNPVEVDWAIEELKRINRDRGVTMIWIEHVLRAVMRLAERVIVLNFGSIIAEGSPSDIAKSAEVVEAYLGRGRAW
jgi:amino acid/amide ABC transporter ATP-binding protein 1, HAAT family (TC 3.A.1.4.-)